MIVDAELRQWLVALGLQAWLDAWETAGTKWPEGDRSWIADAAPGPNYLDRFFAGTQNAIAGVMARKVATAWHSALEAGDTPDIAEDPAWEPAGTGIMNNIGVRVFEKEAATRQRWTFKDHILVQIPDAQQGEFGTFTNRVDVRWTSESLSSGNVDLNVRVIVIGSDGVIAGSFGSPVSPQAGQETYNGDKKVYESRFEIGTFKEGDLVIAQFDRNIDNEEDDTLEDDIGQIEARIV